MRQLVTQAIILSRTDYGEADRILTLLSPEYGKLRLVAKGVRRVKSKLAGGIELFSVSNITFIQGRGDLGTLISTRLIRHYSHIVSDLDRTMAGYELIKLLNKTTEDQAEVSYFTLLQHTFEALDDPHVPLPLVHTWFWAQLLRLGGHEPNLQTTAKGEPLEAGQRYNFELESMSCVPAERGKLSTAHIKLLRLLFAGTTPKALTTVQGATELLQVIGPLVQAMLRAATG